MKHGMQHIKNYKKLYQNFIEGSIFKYLKYILVDENKVWTTLEDLATHLTHDNQNNI